MTPQNQGLGESMDVDGKQSTDGNGAGGSVLDSNDPVLQAPKEIDATKKKPWKRKLIGWSVILLLIVAGVGALYVLMRVKRVNVTVNADSRRDTQSTKPQTVTNSDSHLTAEAINMARTAAGADAQPANSAARVPSSEPSPGPTQDDKVGFTGDSPVFAIGKSGDAGSPQVQLSAAPVKSEASSGVQPQSRANPTQSLFVDDPAPKSTPAPAPIRTPLQTSLELKQPVPAIKKVAPPTVPPFGTMLPVRTQGVIFTLRNNSYARLELTRDMAGTGWSLPKGTVLIGRTTGSEHDRAFINVIGYIDPRENKLVTMTGDVLGSDGANGIPGKRMRVDRSSLKQTLRKVASGGLQVASSMAGAFTGRGTVVIDGAGYRLMDPINDQARGLVNGSERNTFVKVDAEQQAYVMVIDLPSRVEGADAPGTEEHERFNETSLTDREVMELILFGTAEEVRAAMPLMTHEQKRLVLKTQSQESDRP